MRPIIYPYKFGSASARLLSTELRQRGHRAKRVRADGNYSYWGNHLAINWGSSSLPQWPSVRGAQVRWLNTPIAVGLAGNKLTAFQKMQEAGVSIPEFTTSLDMAANWYEEGATIISRHQLSGHSGAGIVLSTEDGISTMRRGIMCPLYVKYVKKAAEYRIHVVKGEVIDVQQKMKRRETPNEEVNYKVRNHANGWIYARMDIDLLSADICRWAIAAVSALGLDFGAVDVVWNNHHQRAYILEVNTAPGLEGTTLTKYANAIERLL